MTIQSMSWDWCQRYDIKTLAIPIESWPWRNLLYICTLAKRVRCITLGPLLKMCNWTVFNCECRRELYSERNIICIVSHRNCLAALIKCGMGRELGSLGFHHLWEYSRKYPVINQINTLRNVNDINQSPKTWNIRQFLAENILFSNKSGFRLFKSNFPAFGSRAKLTRWKIDRMRSSQLKLVKINKNSVEGQLNKHQFVTGCPELIGVYTNFFSLIDSNERLKLSSRIFGFFGM